MSANDFDTIEPSVRRQVRESLAARAKREAEDDEYEASTSGAGRWQERMAQRGRFGRVLDMPPAVRPEEPEPYPVTKEQIDDLTFAAGLMVLLCLAILGLIVYALFTSTGPH